MGQTALFSLIVSEAALMVREGGEATKASLSPQHGLATI